MNCYNFGECSCAVDIDADNLHEEAAHESEED